MAINDLTFFIEISVWILISVFSFIAGHISYRMYDKLPIAPYRYQSYALISFAFFGISIVNFCLFPNLDNLFIRSACVTFCLSLQFYMKFFRDLFGTKRNYEILQLFSALIFGAISAELIFSPFEIQPNMASAYTRLFIEIIMYTTSFGIIVLDYAISSLRKIKQEHLAPKLNNFSLTILVSMSITGIFLCISIYMDIPFYSAMGIQVIFIYAILILLKKYPYFNFLALINPFELMIVHNEGLTLFSYQFQKIEQEELLGGALSAINTIFKESFTHDGIEQIHFKGKIIYVVNKPGFYVVLIDEMNMPFLLNVLKEFADHIAERYNSIIKEFDGNIIPFRNIEEDMKQYFYFFPQLIK